MADKKLNEVSQLTDFDYALVVKGNDVAKVTKQQLATILGELKLSLFYVTIYLTIKSLFLFRWQRRYKITQHIFIFIIRQWERLDRIICGIIGIRCYFHRAFIGFPGSQYDSCIFNGNKVADAILKVGIGYEVFPFYFQHTGRKTGVVESDKQVAVFHAAATDILMPVKGGYELSLERIEVSEPERSIHIPVQVLLYDLKIGLIIDSHNYNIDVTSSISSAVR